MHFKHEINLFTMPVDLFLGRFLAANSKNAWKRWRVTVGGINVAIVAAAIPILAIVVPEVAQAAPAAWNGIAQEASPTLFRRQIGPFEVSIVR
jgi:hypothetical protein